jgi:heptaprenyl diphosphate synthase
MAFQLSDDIMDVTATQLELWKEPGVDLKEGVYTLPVLHALAHSSQREELTRLLQHGPPDGELLDRALEIIRTAGSIAHAREAVTAEVMRAKASARRLPDGRARNALIQLAGFLAARCGAEQGA